MSRCETLDERGERTGEVAAVARGPVGGRGAGRRGQLRSVLVSACPDRRIARGVRTWFSCERAGRGRGSARGARAVGVGVRAPVRMPTSGRSSWRALRCPAGEWERAIATRADTSSEGETMTGLHSRAGSV